MDKKILIDIYLPASYKSFEVIIPYELPICSYIVQLADMLEELSEGMYMVSEQSSLIDKCDGTIININASACELGLKNGSQLMLI